MAKIFKIIEKLEKFAPLDLQSDWDNSGWQICLGDCEVNKLMLALSPTLNIVEQAIENKCNLIIAHHPMIFSKINKINASNYTTLPVIKAIQNNIQVYSAHTNLDTVKNGVAEKFAKLIGLKNTKILEEITPCAGFGRTGELEKEENLTEFISRLKDLLSIDTLKLINPSQKTKVRKIAVCPGSGGDFIKDLKDVDLYITGDIRYHTALEVDNIAVIDAGHLETERIILPVLRDLLKEFDIEIITAQESSPWQVV